MDKLLYLTMCFLRHNGWVIYFALLWSYCILESFQFWNRNVSCWHKFPARDVGKPKSLHVKQIQSTWLTLCTYLSGEKRVKAVKAERGQNFSADSFIFKPGLKLFSQFLCLISVCESKWPIRAFKVIFSPSRNFPHRICISRGRIM